MLAARGESTKGRVPSAATQAMRRLASARAKPGTQLLLILGQAPRTRMEAA